MQKIAIYKDTVRKQEGVIIKMEGLLTKTMQDTAKARDGILELERLKSDNLELQNKLKFD